MSVILILILASLAVALAFLAGFIWAVKSGQFEDTCTPAMRILSEDEAGKQASPEASAGRAAGRSLRATFSRDHGTSGSPSPPLEERGRERRSLFSARTAETLGRQPTGKSPATAVSRRGLLSPALSSKGGEGNGTAASEHRDSCKEQSTGAEQEGRWRVDALSNSNGLSK